jgi:hypothetical protein
VATDGETFREFFRGVMRTVHVEQRARAHTLKVKKKNRAHAPHSAIPFQQVEMSYMCPEMPGFQDTHHRQKR